MKHLSDRSLKRRGAVVPLAALLMTVLMGMLAFSVDVGYIASVKAELQNAADSAALAGAEQLQSLYVQYHSPGATNQSTIYSTATTNNGSASPIATAERFASYNQAGGVFLQVPDSDVSIGFNDGTNPITSASTTNFPNTVTVTTRRDNVSNGPLGLFFGKIFGVNTVNLTATASATIFSGDGTSLQIIYDASGNALPVNAHILPVALDVNVWNQYVATGQSPDGNIYNGPNGNPQLQVYPFATNTPGSFGLLDVGQPSNSTPAFRNWIDDGSTPNDISYLLNNNLLPVSPSAPEPWKCGPGLKSTLLSNFQSQIGAPNLIPLFTPVSTSPYVAASGNGQNATYAIIGFVGVTISQATGDGNNNMNISIQPAAIVDPTLVINNASPARASQSTMFSTSQTSNNLGTTFISAKLTQ